MKKALNIASWMVITCLGAMTFGSISYAIIQVVSGNYHGTASFEF